MMSKTEPQPGRGDVPTPPEYAIKSNLSSELQHEKHTQWSSQDGAGEP